MANRDQRLTAALEAVVPGKGLTEQAVAANLYDCSMVGPGNDPGLSQMMNLVAATMNWLPGDNQNEAKTRMKQAYNTFCANENAPPPQPVAVQPWGNINVVGNALTRQQNRDDFQALTNAINAGTAPREAAQGIPGMDIGYEWQGPPGGKYANKRGAELKPSGGGANNGRIFMGWYNGGGPDNNRVRIRAFNGHRDDYKEQTQNMGKNAAHASRGNTYDGYELYEGYNAADGGYTPVIGYGQSGNAQSGNAWYFDYSGSSVGDGTAQLIGNEQFMNEQWLIYGLLSVCIFGMMMLIVCVVGAACGYFGAKVYKESGKNGREVDDLV